MSSKLDLLAIVLLWVCANSLLAGGSIPEQDNVEVLFVVSRTHFVNDEGRRIVDNESDLGELLKKYKMESEDIHFRVIPSKAEQRLFEVIKLAVAQIDEEQAAHERKFPGLHQNIEPVGGGTAGILSAKNGAGKFLDVCLISKDGTPSHGREEITLKNEDRLVLDKLLLKLLLDSKREVKIDKIEPVLPR